MAKDDTSAEDLLKDLGRLNLNLDGRADGDTTASKGTAPQTRYNLGSRRKGSTTDQSKLSQPTAKSTGTRQATATSYIPPYLRGKNTSTTTSKDTDKTTANPATTNNELPIRPRGQNRTTGKKKSKILNANAPTFQPSLTWQAPIDDTSDLKDARLTIAKSAKKIVHVLKRPTPSPEYLEQARRLVQTLESPRQLLIVLDLNGTLVHRKQPRGGSSFVARPKLNEFLQYLFTYHKVMVWSSAKPKNVNAMCEKLFDKDQRQELIAVWARDTLRLPDASYNSKVQVYKQLHWTWHDKRIQAATPDAKSGWDQSNTVLIDDSVEKAASEPHNLICLEEFQNSPEQRKSDVLGQVVKYLELLKHEKDVSAFMQLMPFRYEAGEKFDWRI